ncbi:hypothetical protein [Streptomyces canus]|uniref:hypothetical protein n=1 Tax=Streptomyces canus TaxID=58343 RepID=UPI002DDBEB1D|nr:hypothetical protein [Streptomyces canus]WSD84500.1 hypothetical protein OG925_09410 [Streptomyces canus]
MARNVAEHVRVTRDAVRKSAQDDAKRRPWDASEVKAFIEATKGDRLFGVMLLTLIAERRAEVCGTRWEQDVDLRRQDGTIAVGNTRTIVYDRSLPKGQRNKVVEKDPKTHNGKRVLPLAKLLQAALVVLRARQADRARAFSGGEMP